MTQTAAPRRTLPWRILAPIILVAAGVICYANTLAVPLIFDDLKAIEQNPSIRTLWPAHEAMFAPPRNTFAGRPVVNLSFALNHALFGPDVRAYHATNIFIHVLTALALFALLRRTLRLPRLRDRFGLDADGLSLAATLLWAVHPLLSEVVTYTSTRTEGLMALFFVLTVYCAARAFEPAAATSGGGADAEARPARRWRVAAVASCAIGMGCKEVMAVAPVVVYLYDALLVHGSLAAPARRRPGFYLLLAATWLIVPALLYFTVDFSAKSGFGLERMTPWVYALTQSGVIVHYLRLAVWPRGQTIDYYDWPLAHAVSDVWPQLLFVLLLAALTAWGVARRRPAALLGAWVLLVLAPTSSVVPLGSEIAAERRMYLPMMAIVAGAVLVAYRVLLARGGGGGARGARGIAMIGVVALAIVLGGLTVRRNAEYESGVTIWSRAVDVRPRNVRALSELSRVLQVAGRNVEARQVAERAAALDPDYPESRAFLGALLIGEGRPAEAAEHLRAAVRLDPNHALTRANLGLALARQGRTEEAIREYREALRLDAHLVDAHVYLAEALEARGDVAGARNHLEAALRLEPGAADIRAQYERLRAK